MIDTLMKLCVGFIIGLVTAAWVHEYFDRTTPMDYAEGRVVMKILDDNPEIIPKVQDMFLEHLENGFVSVKEFRKEFHTVAQLVCKPIYVNHETRPEETVR